VRHREGSSWRERIGPRVRVRNRMRSGLLLLRGGWLQILQTAVAACAAWFLSVLILDVDRPTFAPIAAVICLGLAVGDRADVRGGVRGRHRGLSRLGRRGRGPAGRPRRGPGHGRGRVSGPRGDRRQRGRYPSDDHPHNLPRAGHRPPAGALSGGPDRGCDRPPDKRRVARQPRTHGGGGRPPALRRFGGRAGGGGGRPG
jgi:hypothetical protein